LDVLDQYRAMLGPSGDGREPAPDRATLN
jgi:hypothetical protein